ncbi:GTP-binding protein [Amycolatopsis sp. FDAARGOS 1241]|uniref:GTP-binding protein n=1 Tax=Amycolatopsis sp. FDAARGOS 1241 TaxID=2778070 RepID=UPI00351C4E3F
MRRQTDRPQFGLSPAPMGPHPRMHTLTLGILAHVDAGKTSLTERLLFETGVIDHLGSVDGGDTQTDSLDLEHRRGITIKSAVVAVTTDEHRLTLVDTPGHSDFIAEVERVLGVLDGAVLVVSATDGVQAQTRVLMRTLRRLGIPVLVFVNKIDRAGAQEATLLHALRTRLSPRCVALDTVTGLGTPQAKPAPLPPGPALADALADDDEFLASYVDGGEPDYQAALARQVALGAVHRWSSAPRSRAPASLRWFPGCVNCSPRGNEPMPARCPPPCSRSNAAPGRSRTSACDPARWP